VIQDRVRPTAQVEGPHIPLCPLQVGGASSSGLERRTQAAANPSGQLPPRPDDGDEAGPDDEVVDDEDDGGGVELGASKALPIPVAPTAAEKAAHEVCHLPFRSWCVHCVRGRAKHLAHSSSNSTERQQPLVGVDFGYLGVSDESTAGVNNLIPILVARDADTKMVLSAPLPSKHCDESSCRVLADFITVLGWPRVTLRSDQEPALVAMAAGAKKILMDRSVTVVLEESPAGASQSNGMAEQTVGAVAAQCRVMLSALETSLGKKVPAEAPILAWMMRYSGVLLSLFERGHDGKTAFSRLKGKEFKEALPAFGEQVMAHVKVTSKLQAKWVQATYLGIRLRASEKMVHIPDSDKKVYVVRSIRRRTELEAWNADLVFAVLSTPWSHESSRLGLPAAAGTAGFLSGDVLAPGEIAVADVNFKKMMLMKEDFIKFGFSPDCTGCRGLRLPGAAKGAHSAACRDRVVALIRSSPEGEARFQKSESRLNEQMAAATDDIVNPAAAAPAAAAAAAAAAATVNPSAVPSVGIHVPRTPPGPPPSTPPRQAAASAAGGGGDAMTDSVKRRVVFVDEQGDDDMTGGGGGGRRRRRLDDAVVVVPDAIVIDDGYDDVDDIFESANTDMSSFFDRQIASFNAAVAVVQNSKFPVADEEQGVMVEAEHNWSPDDERFHEHYYDEMTNLVLPQELVKSAIDEELQYMRDLGVWDHFPTLDAAKAACTKAGKVVDVVTGSRWVIVNKQDPKDPLVRARLVATEVKKERGMNVEYFSSTPPLEALRMLITIASSRRRSGVMLVDIKKAHLNGRSQRTVIVKLPAEAGGGHAVLRRALYGTRDAAKCWSLEVRRVLEAAGLTTGLCSDQVWYTANFQGLGPLWVLCHGDDIFTVGDGPALSKLRAILEAEWKLSFKGILSDSADLRTTSSFRILGRYLSCDSVGLHLEGDARHVELLTVGLVGKDSKVNTPCVRREEDEDTTLLVDGDVTMYRSLTMRAAYLALDRPDLCYCVNQLARDMAKPTVSSLAAIKRLGRYLKFRPRVDIVFAWRCSLPSVLVVETDADFAGCKRTRKSTSGLVCMWGSALIRASSKTQSVISLSTSESEFYATVGATSTGLGLQQLALDLGCVVALELRSDATASMVMSMRSGLGRAKHISVSFLWIQSVLQQKKAVLNKVGTDKNRSDIGTKPLTAQRIEYLLSLCSCYFLGGRHELALDVACL